VARLEAQLAKVRADRDKVREEAGAAGGEVGVLRKQVRKLTEASTDAGGRTTTGPPVIIEAKTVSEWEGRLESARRENDRLRGQLEQTDRENDRLASELRRETETAERLRQALERRMRVVARGIGPRPGAKGVTAASEAGRAAKADALVTALPFEYEGPDGSFRLRGSFRLVVPDSVVKRLGLVSGDLVTVTVTPDRRVELKVLIRAVSESVLGSVKRVAVEDGRGAWQVIGLDRQPLGWVSEAEFTARSLADGDAVTVTRAGRKVGEPPRGLWSPAVGLPALPRCRVLQKHEAPAAESLPAAPAKRRAVRRAVAGEKPETGRYSGEMRAFARQRPLVGKKVLVVGGDSFKAGYRAIVENLGAEFEFQGAGRDMTMVKSRARAADIVVLVTEYLSHKVSGVVTDTMKADGREVALCYAGSKGRGAILEALRPHFRAVNGEGGGMANSAGAVG
jgi:bifunctional DNA-binding transcriptional regulator/antitoxin component of YhaV-PrlF toxin-antitoxin module